MLLFVDQLEAFEQRWGQRYPAIVRLWRNHWNEFTPFLAFPPDVRRVVYTTDEIVNSAAECLFCGPACPPPVQRTASRSPVKVEPPVGGTT
jgi:hypothetical protein